MEIIWLVLCVAAGIIKGQPVEPVYSTPDLSAVRSEPAETPGDADDAFQFAYAVASPEHGTYHGHQATRDQQGHTSGSYYALGADGNWRQTIYADKGQGFQALSNQRPAGSPPPQVSAVNYQIFVHPGATAISASGSGPPAEISLFRVKGAGRALPSKNGLFLGSFFDDSDEDDDDSDDDDDTSFSLESDYDNDDNDDIFRQNFNFNFRHEDDNEENELEETENDDDNDENENDSVFPKFATPTTTSAFLPSPVSTRVSPSAPIPGRIPSSVSGPVQAPLSASPPTRIPAFVPARTPAEEDEDASAAQSEDANSNENGSEFPQHAKPVEASVPRFSTISNQATLSTPLSRKIPAFAPVAAPASPRNPGFGRAPTPAPLRIPAFSPATTPAPAFVPATTPAPAFAPAVTISPIPVRNLDSAFGTPAPIAHSSTPSPVFPSVHTPSPVVTTPVPFNTLSQTPVSAHVINPAPSFVNAFSEGTPSIHQTSESFATPGSVRVSSAHQNTSPILNPALNSASAPIFPFAFVPTSAFSSVSSPVNTASQQRAQHIIQSLTNTPLQSNLQQSLNNRITSPINIRAQAPIPLSHTTRLASQLPDVAGGARITQTPLSAFVQNSVLTALPNTIAVATTQTGSHSPVNIQTQHQQVNPSTLIGAGVPLAFTGSQSSGSVLSHLGRADNALAGSLLSHSGGLQSTIIGTSPIHSINRSGVAADSGGVGIPLFTV
ncbi:BCL-6 corepressor-like protein 1 [Macrobrachium rosenbergii]|uniref:BCL-6 corepressor-like protein 1 n=1 Tax=Macrobrachium rosenbergii TaxID=79674 RepID=UPI0034D3E6B6